MPSTPEGNIRPFAERLRALMREQGLSNDAVFLKTGISPRLVAKYKAGATEPRDYFGDPTENAHLLAEALGIEVGDLLPPREGNGDTTPTEAAA